MGMLDLMRLMSMQRLRDQERCRRQAQAPNGLIASRAKRKGSPCQRDDDSQGIEIQIYPGPSLPDASQRNMEHVSIFTDPSDLRQMREQHLQRMKSVKILGFSSAKSLVELTCHVVESIRLECLTLETHQSSLRCSVPDHKSRKCSPLPVGILMEAQRALLAIRRYIEPKVPSTVKLHVVETCRRCHAVEL